MTEPEVRKVQELFLFLYSARKRRAAHEKRGRGRPTKTLVCWCAFCGNRVEKKRWQIEKYPRIFCSNSCGR